jgi:SAM-dependent methyltransferase
LKSAPEVPWILQTVRGALRRVNASISRHRERTLARTHPPPNEAPDPRVIQAEACLRQLDISGKDALAYFEKHLPRLARTLALVPKGSGAVLELGAYLQLTPFLSEFCGYSTVRGAHFGPAGYTDDKIARVNGKRISIPVDLFDAENDPFPYDDGSFETVLVCEMIEHLLRDPIQMLLECRRVLVEGGRLLVTTPNTASLTSVARVLHGYSNPQIYAQYSIPAPGTQDIPHVREYTAFELRDTMEAAGFEIETLITEPIAEFGMNLPMWNFLEEQGYDTSLRGEQTYCVAVKREALPVTRYPKFLYA